MAIGKSLQGFAITLCNIAYDLFFQAFGIAARTPALIKESTANAEFAFKNFE